MQKIITVFGSCAWDRTFKIGKDGEYPTEPTFESPGGKGANQAVAAARGGAKDVAVHMISIVGDDDVGKKIIKNLVNEGINTERVEILSGVASDGANIRLDENNENFIERIPNSAINYYTNQTITKNADLLKKSDVVLAQSKTSKEITKFLVEFCFENNIDLIITPSNIEKFDPKDLEDIELFKKVRYVAANKKEALAITGTNSVEDALKILPNMIVTKSEKGVAFVLEGKVVKFNALPAEVVDTTGAGDTFLGNFVASTVGRNYDFITSIKRGIVASTLKVAVKGAQTGMPQQNVVNEEFENRLINEYNI